jgi:lysophospholipid acyltransferase (LPLAT)-like uncharacterized protein
MDDPRAAPPAVSAPVRKGRRAGPVKSLWRKVRQPLAQSRFAKDAITLSIVQALRFIWLTNRVAEGSDDVGQAHAKLSPAIIAMWHGQHLLAPMFFPRKADLVAMVSRSADAELNAMVLERLGIESVRGSGGREGTQHMEKGGARALIALKRALDANRNVCMIADIPHGTPRQAGMGIVTLARLSGRAVVPVAVATSRRKVLERSWDKTTINLPFGRSAIIIGDPIHVSADAGEAEMEQKRRDITDGLNAATGRVYRVVDAAQ